MHGCAREQPWDHKWCHIEVPVDAPSVFYTMPWPAPCSGAVPTWYTIEVADVLAFIEETAIQDTHHTCACQCRDWHWDPPSWDPAVEGQQPASMRRQGSRVDEAVWVWEHMMHKQAAYYWNATRWHTSVAKGTILSEWSVIGHLPRQWNTCPWKSSNLPLWEHTCAWIGQFELGNAWCINKLHIPKASTRWNTADGGYERLHLYPMCIFFPTTDHRFFGVSLHGYIGVSRGPQALWPSCLWRQNIHHHTGHATDICPWLDYLILLSGGETRTWWFLSSSSGSTPWPQWNGRSFFQDHLWVIWDTEAGTTTFLCFLVFVLWQLLSQWISCLAQLHLRDVGEPTPHPCSMTGMMQDHHLFIILRLWVTWDIYMRDLLWHREEVLSGLGTSLLKA